MPIDSYVAMEISVFLTPLGWLGFVAANDGVTALTLGHTNRGQAWHALGMTVVDSDRNTGRIRAAWPGELRAALLAYAVGEPVELNCFPLAPRERTSFQRHVIDVCRAIPRGRTISYAQAALQAGHPGAARAVGQVMATNQTPLLIPCHRILAAGGLGGFTAPGGLDLKRRLLQLENAAENYRVELSPRKLTIKPAHGTENSVRNTYRASENGRNRSGLVTNRQT